MSEVTRLEKALRKLTTSDDVQASQIASTAERILSLQPSHVYAMQCKSVALIHAGRFAAALRVLESLQREKTGFKNTATFHLHKAYCHYRLMQYTEAKEELLGQQQQLKGPMPTAARHLLAQIHYNLEEYAEAAAAYAELLAHSAYRDEVEKQELLTNYTASLSACAPEKVSAVVRDEADEKTPDLLFNLATAQVEAENYEGAQATLLQAEQLCAAAFPKSKLRSLRDALAAGRETLEAELGVPLVASTSISGGRSIKESPERCFFNEVSSNWVQQAYVAFMLHREADARRIVDLILTYKPSSAVTSAVAAILHTALQRSADFLDSHRKLKAAQHVKVLSRLTSKQLLAVQYNTALLQLSVGALDRCTRTVEQMKKAHPNSELTHSLCLVLAVRKLKKKVFAGNSASSLSRPTRSAADSVRDVQECLRNYEAEATRRQGAGSSEAENWKRRRFMQLITAQLFLDNGDLTHALEALQALEDPVVVQRPTTVMTMASWKVQIGDVDGAVELLRKRLTAMADGYSATVKKAMLLWAVHDLAMARGLYAAVGQLVKATQAADVSLQKDREVTALLVMCLAETDVAAAKSVVGILDADAAAALNGVSSDCRAAPSEKEIEAQVRDNPGVAVMNELGYRRVTAADQEGAAGGGGLPRRRRRPMRRPAKNMEGKPDPERWIPISMRSYIKDLPERRKKELKRLRAIDQEQKRRAAAAAIQKLKKAEQQQQQEEEAFPAAAAV
ncbi:hypothetical protein CUR178_06445 [Leishmania enriettii]|uniref:Signal recognition particle subunit SRP72 n=1 Tax=Leishmania enriettii TaxID=5663 RepID=A0A836HRC2_LEIEN|nr:hypothetical protein CUR178_06445 [Leishmania enriettii]